MKSFCGVINTISYDGDKFALSVDGVMREELLFCSPEDINFAPVRGDTGVTARPRLAVGVKVRFSGGMPDGDIHPTVRDIHSVEFAQICLPNGFLVNEP